MRLGIKYGNGASCTLWTAGWLYEPALPAFAINVFKFFNETFYSLHRQGIKNEYWKLGFLEIRTNKKEQIMIIISN